jgi:cobalt-zinc-cadmium resistance protein CzcA
MAEEKVGGMILMLKGANPNKVITSVKQRISQIQKYLPPGVIIEPYLDRSSLIERTTSTLSKNLTEGALIVVFVLVFLLGSIRGGLVTASVIPLALLFAFILMKITNVWANLMSLGAIDFGIIVDGAVIIVEGTVHLLHDKTKKVLTQKDMDEVAYRSASTMMNAAFFGQLIILIVFAPILFLSGVEGKMFHPMAYTFGYAVIGAIILCLTYVPMITSLVMKPSEKKGWISKIENTVENFSNKIINRLYKLYFPVLQTALNKGKLTIALALLLLFSAVYEFSQMGGEFIPQLDEGDLALQVLIKPGSSLEEMIRVTEKIEHILKESFPEVITSGARIGVADIPTDPMPMDVGDMFIVLEKDIDKWQTAKSKAELIEKMEQKLNEELVGVNFVFSQPVELRFNELLTGVREDVAIKIFGEDMQILNKLSARIAGLIKSVPGVADVSPERISGLPQITVTYNRKKMARYGLSVSEVSDYINTAFAGKTSGIVFEGEKRFDIVVRLSEKNRKNIQDVKHLYIPLNNGSQIPLSEIATIEYIDGPMQISRENTFRRTYVGVNVRNRDVESVIKDVQNIINTKANIPPGYYVQYGGEFENLVRAKERLSIVVPVALLLIFVLLYFALGSISQSVMIYFAIPLASIGGVFFLALRGMPFSISAGVGFIVLFGVAILNGLVLINRLNTLKAEGIIDIKKRIELGTKERLRPILLTATAAIMGFTPMAFSASAGAEVQRPLATVVIGGLISATLLTLIILPVLYYFMEKKKNSINKILPNVAVIILFFATVSFQKVQAQTVKTFTTPEQAFKIALQNNGETVMAEKDIEKAILHKKAAFNPGKTDVDIQYGQYNSFYNDISFTVLQPFEFPLVYARQKQMAEEKIKLSTFEFETQKAILKRNVYKEWNTLSMLLARRKLLFELDSVYKNFAHVANVRYQVQDASYLEKLASETKSKSMGNKLLNTNAEISISKAKIRQLLNDTTFYDFKPALFLPFETQEEFTLQTIENHPAVQKVKQEISLALQQRKLASAKMLPDFSVGFFSMTMQGNLLKNGDIAGANNQFNGLMAKVSIPLFYGSFKNNIKLSKITQEQSTIKYGYIKNTYYWQFEQLFQTYLIKKNNLEYYQNTALKQADEIYNTAFSAYNSQAIGYIELIQLLEQSYQIRQEYLQALHEFNNSIIELNYLLNK